MMYSGSIYKIYDNTNGNVYYGSTSERLIGKRLAHHRADYKRWSSGKRTNGCKSFDIIKNGDFDISLVEKVYYEEKVELHRRERFYIENNECLNKNVPTRTDKEYREEHKEERNEYLKKYREEHKEDIAENNKKYREEHKEDIAEYNKKYKEEHKEVIIEKNKKYKEEHKEVIIEKNKKYREQNRDKINAKQRERRQQAKQAKELLDKGLGNS